MLTACGTAAPSAPTAPAEPGETYAQVLFYQESFTYDVAANDGDHNVSLVSEVEKSSYFDRYLAAVK